MKGLFLNPVLFFSLSLSAGHASTFTVFLDTSPLAGGLYSMMLYLIDGDATANNSVTAANAQFGGGSLVGNAMFTGGGSGSFPGGVTLTDTDFFNMYSQDFFPGSSLSFDLALTTNFAGGPPDSLAFVLFDYSTGSPVPTLDPDGTDVLFVFDLSQTGPGQSYASDPERTDLLLAAPVLTQNEPASVPEPGSLLLTGIALLAFVLLARR
ncbi:MAG: NF038129 family PEP-CTERM protein [Bryobacterales bacterium]|nr:NF038129 family PEP-CTERM protein [Bryobacterales bacterium]